MEKRDIRLHLPVYLVEQARALVGVDVEAHCVSCVVSRALRDHLGPSTQKT